MCKISKSHCIVGIYEKERELKQNLFLDIEMDLDFGDAANTEDVSHTVDYAEVSDTIEAWVQDQKIQLIETLAEQGCQLIFEKWHPYNVAISKSKTSRSSTKLQYAAVSVNRFRSQ